MVCLVCFSWVFSRDLNSQGLVKQTLQINGGIICDSLSYCQNMYRLFLEIQGLGWGEGFTKTWIKNGSCSLLTSWCRGPEAGRMLMRASPARAAGAVWQYEGVLKCSTEPHSAFRGSLVYDDELKLQVKHSKVQDIAGVAYMIYLTLRT